MNVALPNGLPVVAPGSVVNTRLYHDLVVGLCNGYRERLFSFRCEMIETCIRKLWRVGLHAKMATNLLSLALGSIRNHFFRDAIDLPVTGRVTFAFSADHCPKESGRKLVRWS